MISVQAQKLVQAPLGEAYRAFTNATALREWLCDVATVVPRPGGRIYLWWNGDFYSAGHFLEVEEEKQVKFRWFSNLDPGPSEITVAFETQGKATLVSMTHSVPEGQDWAGRAEGFRQEWQSSLENLASVLETGKDLRIVNRPMIGIVPSDFNEEIARHLGVPVSEGMRLDDTVEGMGAHKAGLRKDDVIVGVDGKTIDNDFGSFAQAIRGKKGGDVVEVTYYRGPAKHTVNMELSRRPVPEVPFDPRQLARAVREQFNQALPDLRAAFAGFSDEQASRRPAPAEWSALDVVAHLIHTERNNRQFIDQLLGGFEPAADDFGGNNDAYVRATVAIYPTIEAILGELERSIAENIAFLSNLSAEFAARKGSYFRLGWGMLLGTTHIRAHIEQIKAALAAAK
jgi:uncharacterized protein YndB with AHSA1/START domain